MKISLVIDGLTKSVPNGTYEDAQRFLELIDATNPDSFDLQFEDNDHRFLQLMHENCQTMVCVAKPVGNGQLLCRYSKDTCNFPHASVVNIVNDFFDGEAAFLYIDWNTELDDYIPIESNTNATQRVETGTQAKGGCYVATAVYGSYDCPQVWTLRRFRDNTLAATWYGRAFIRTYYAISPTLVKWFGNTNWFKKLWKGKLDRMVSDLNKKGVENTPYDDKTW